MSDPFANIPRRSGRVRRPTPTSTHEAFAKTIVDLVHSAISEMATTTGTVVGDDGGNTLVEFDEESGPREVGIPHKQGQGYKGGDRVIMHRLKGKSWVIGGTVGSGRQRIVGQSDMEGGSVDYNILHPQVSSDISSARSRAELGIDRAGSAQNDANDARNRANDARSRADNAQNRADDARNRADNAQDKADAAQSKANSAQSKAESAANTADSGKKKLSGKTFKASKNGSLTLPSW